MEQPQTMQNVLSAKSLPGAPLTANDCLKLMQQLPSNKVPTECDHLLKEARAKGLLPRGASRTFLTNGAQPWNPATGHGVRPYLFERDGYDNSKGKNESVDEHFLKGRTPEEQQKIRLLRTRMSARGALNVTGVDEKEVANEKMKDIQRKQSRRDQYRRTSSKPTTPSSGTVSTK